MMSRDELKAFLDEKVDVYNRPNFIENDPISIPHQFTKIQDIEIAGFIAATLAWGNRKSIIQNASKFISYMDNDPHEFILHFSKNELTRFKRFTHRTFNAIDAVNFIQSFRTIYKKHNSLETIFLNGKTTFEKISSARKLLIENFENERTTKHVSNPANGSSAKRINMFLRWMVRKDKNGVDFGIWKKINPQDLLLPLDVHTGNVARKLGLTTRNSNDTKTVEEIMIPLREFCKEDPVKYDFALFGLGAIEKF